VGRRRHGSRSSPHVMAWPAAADLVESTSAQAREYIRHRPEQSSLYELVRDNLETLYGAIDDGAVDIRLPKYAKKELEAYLDCGLLCRGFARLKCQSCTQSRLVAFSCKGRGFCPACLGRRMCATAANLMERVLPQVALRQWVLTFPFAWRARLASDAALLGRLTGILVQTVHDFYVQHGVSCGGGKGKTGAVTVVQRTSSDLRLNPHLHVIFLDGTYHENGSELEWTELGHLKTTEVGQVLHRAVLRMSRHLSRRAKRDRQQEPENQDAEHGLLGSAVSGQTPPAGPQWLRGLEPSSPSALAYEKPLCASFDGFTLHAGTRAGALATAGREALLRYALRPPIGQERIVPQQDGMVRIVLKRAFSDGTVAVDMDPLSLLCRLVTSVPAPRSHTVKYSGVLASASRWRSRITPHSVSGDTSETTAATDAAQAAPKRGTYRPWAELLRRTFGVDVLSCPRCQGRMKLLAMVTDAKSVARYLANIGEPTEVPGRSPNRGPPFWKSAVLRRKALGNGSDAG
jgi:hypothetical protein